MPSTTVLPLKSVALPIIALALATSSSQVNGAQASVEAMTSQAAEGELQGGALDVESDPDLARKVSVKAVASSVPRPRSWFGYGTSWIDDVDGDGVRDLAVPDHTYTAEELPVTTYGVVFLLSGVDGHVIRTLAAKQGDRRFGWATVATQDFDGDGVGELLVYGSRNRIDGSQDAFVRAFSPASGRQLWERRGVPRPTWVSGMTGGADLDGDGIDDVLLWGGFPRSGEGTESTAELMLLSGREGRVLRELTFTRPGVDQHERCPVHR